MRSIALANQKGGVGKTTTAMHLAHGLGLAGHSVALLDLDPQGNATVALQAMATGSAAEGAFARLTQLRDDVWILPSPGSGNTLARDLKLDVEGLVRLADELREAGLQWLIVDCPPRMDEWGWAGLRLCDEVLVPVPAEFFPMHGLSQMLRTLDAARSEFPGKASLLGVLVTMLDSRETVAREVLADLRKNLGDRLLESIIYRDPVLVEAASHGLTVFDYRLCSKGARSYGELVREVLYGRTSSG